MRTITGDVLMLRLALAATLLLPGLALANGPSKGIIKTVDKFGKKGLSYEQVANASQKLGLTLDAEANQYNDALAKVSHDRVAPLLIGIEFQVMSNGEAQTYRGAWLHTAEGYRLAELDPRWTAGPEAEKVAPSKLAGLVDLTEMVAEHMRTNTCDAMPMIRSEDIATLGFPASAAEHFEQRAAEAPEKINTLCGDQSPTQVQLSGGAFGFGLYNGDTLSGVAVYELRHSEDGWYFYPNIDPFETENDAPEPDRFEKVTLELPEDPEAEPTPHSRETAPAPNEPAPHAHE